MRISYETSKFHPERQHSTDAAYDLHAIEDTNIPARGWITVHTGLRISIPSGYAGLILSRSGLASRGLYVLNAPGVVDAGYSGEIKVILANMHELSDMMVYAGDRIAQFMLVKLEEYYMLPGSVYSGIRGDNGFGSTGN